MIKFGFQHRSYTRDGAGPKILQALKRWAQYAEVKGFDSFWVMDHFIQTPFAGTPQEPVLEGWSALSALAAVTERIRLGTLVTGNIYRNPALLAKMGATVDVISNGRLNMGIGAGWYEAEAAAYGFPFYTARERLKRLEEALQIIKGMWTNDSFSFEGKYYVTRDAKCFPKPIQQPHPPIMVGGGGENVTLKLVAKYADACNVFGGPRTVKRKLEKLKEHCKAVGRDCDEVLKTKLGQLIIGENEQDARSMVGQHRKPGMTDEEYDETAIHGTPEQVTNKIQEFAEIGVEYMIVNTDFLNEEKIIKLFAERVMPEFIS
jgi:F420-dependent oxidoreductase-like protein